MRRDGAATVCSDPSAAANPRLGLPGLGDGPVAAAAIVLRVAWLGAPAWCFAQASDGLDNAVLKHHTMILNFHVFPLQYSIKLFHQISLDWLS